VAGGQELDLDLVQAGAGGVLLGDGDDVVEDVGDRHLVADDAPPEPPRGEGRDRDERLSAQVGGQEIERLRWRLRAATGQLDLEPAALGRELQLPANAARA